ncbi:MAG: argininosuccinate lyase [Ruminococcaceae bacterium]|nr:argininosuccinate lyase [Oscillospiraceae bacterium]
MDKMWAGRFSKQLDKLADDFNSSIRFDCRMYKQDIEGSIAHALMLASKGIISAEDSSKIIEGLTAILEDIETGALEFDMNAEDIHMFIESELTKRIGDAGKRLHTARSRNDQVALDIRMYLRAENEGILQMLRELITTLRDKAAENTDAIMPGYTHLQRAQPVTFAHHILAYAMMFIRDYGRIKDAVKRMNSSPIGSCALAGTTYNTDRYFEAQHLGFDTITMNSIDGVSDRDFCLELLSAYSVLMMHLSRFCEEVVMWSSWEFKFIELDDSYSTGSSIMPQKKNPDMAELIRGKCGRVYGDLVALLTTLKGLPLAYNKDMQEDKEAIFDALDTVKLCLSVFTPMIATATVLKDNMYTAAQKGFINATDLADYLVKKGMPFRSAYKLVGETVAYCIENKTVLEDLPFETYKELSPLFEEDVYSDISLEACVNKRISEGGTGPKSVQTQIDYVTEFLNG